ncbi:MAG: hypothetical protein QOE37_15 [Microbacteriaceae bacterium]|nr:hypothetical protein [Microbacteriaceae bacterium]
MALPAGRSVRRAPFWDAPVTVALLALGVLNVTRIVAAARDMAGSLAAIFVAQGIGQYTQVGLATGIGWAVIAESILSLVIAIAVSVPRIRDHRTAFWVPILAAAVTGLLTFLLVSAAILADPAYVDWLQHH